jgi:hypothetical protein
MSTDNTNELPDLLEECLESPDYQRFIALNILVPQIEGKRIYHRVTITGSLKDLADDLSSVLPSSVLTLLRRQVNTVLSIRNSHSELPSPHPKRAPYVVLCSCGVKDCEHADYAIRHFQLVQSFADNSGRVSNLIRQSQRKILETESRLQLLDHERQEIACRLEEEKRKGEQVEELQLRLRAKDLEKADLSLQVEEAREEQERLQRIIETHQQNLKEVMDEFWRKQDSSWKSMSKDLPSEMLNVLNHYFIPPPSNILPSEKLQKNVSSDHHRVSRTKLLLPRLAAIDFVRGLGLDYRHDIKSGKVQIKQRVEELELLVPYKGEADIIRILTTAHTKAQQLFAAHLIAERFGVEVQY